RAPLEKAVREVLVRPPQEDEQLSVEGLGELIDLVYGASSIDPLVEVGRCVWRTLLDPSKDRLELAKTFIDDGISLLDSASKQRTPHKKAAPEPGAKEA